MSYSPLFRGNSASAPSRALVTNFQNATGGIVAKSTPVCVNASGQLIAMDVSSTLIATNLVGIAASDIAIAANGPVMDAGRLEDVTTGYAVGDPLYVSKAGFLTNTKPDIGVGGFVAGDYVIFVGIVVKNEFNLLLKDIKLMLDIVGRL